MKKLVYKQALYEEAVIQGLTQKSDFRAAFPLGYDLPKETLARWLARFCRVEDYFSKQRRYVNRFCLGADPEFIFTQGAEQRINAYTLGLKQGLAFGSDNNGRLAEVRPYPSRSALEMCASMFATMRWVYLWCPDSRNLAWQCGPYLQQDGLGGHVHFGRKRPTRADEIKALDRINELLMACHIYRQAEVDARQAGDARGQRYGQPGDFRMQRHGYEYRTYPSWLDSPMLAFLIVTLSKLAVHNPSLVRKIQLFKDAVPHMLNLCLYYKDVDDDARLASVILTKFGMPRHLGGDFKERWGLTPTKVEGSLEGITLPDVIPPSEVEIRELFDHLMTGKALAPPAQITPTWKHSLLPKGYKQCIDRVHTVGHKGLGEEIWDLCYHETIRVEFTSRQTGHNDRILTVSRDFASLLPSGWQDERSLVGNLENGDIQINNHFLHEPFNKEFRSLILSGKFPVWDIRTVKEDSIKDWKLQFKVNPKRTDHFTSKVLYVHGRPII